MGWTDLSTWDGNWQSLDFLNEFVAAINERGRAVRQGHTLISAPLTPIAAGANMQQAPYWNDPTLAIVILQSRIISMFGMVGSSMAFARTIDSAGNPIVNFDSFSGDNVHVWDGIANAAPHITGMSGATGLRRYRTHPDDGGTVLFGPMQSGDIIGRWIFEDMQKALNLLVWAAFGGDYDYTTPLYIHKTGFAKPTIAEEIADWTSRPEYSSYTPSAFTLQNIVQYGVQYIIQTSKTRYLQRWLAADGWPAGPGVAGEMDVYAPPSPTVEEFGNNFDGVPIYTFDDCGFGLHYHAWTMLDSGIAIAAGDAQILTPYYGDNTTVRPGWPPADGTHGFQQGYVPTADPFDRRLHVVVRWDVPGGFEYVAV